MILAAEILVAVILAAEILAAVIIACFGSAAGAAGQSVRGTPFANNEHGQAVQFATRPYTHARAGFLPVHALSRALLHSLKGGWHSGLTSSSGRFCMLICNDVMIPSISNGEEKAAECRGSFSAVRYLHWI